MTVGGSESMAEERELSCVQFSQTVYRQQTGTVRQQRRRQRHLQVPKTSAAPQDSVQPHPVSGRAQARPGWRTVGQPGNHCCISKKTNLQY